MPTTRTVSIPKADLVVGDGAPARAGRTDVSSGWRRPSQPRRSPARVPDAVTDSVVEALPMP